MEKIVLQVKPEFHKNNNKYFKYLGVIWLILGVGMLLDQNVVGWFYLILGGVHYYYHKSIDHSYHSTITNGIYKANTWFASKTNLLKAQKVKKFAGDVTFVFPHKEIRIDTQVLDQESIDALDQFIIKHEIPCEVIPVR
jgi:hypothetical protein